MLLTAESEHRLNAQQTIHLTHCQTISNVTFSHESSPSLHQLSEYEGYAFILDAKLCLVMSSVSSSPCHPDNSVLLNCLHSSQLLRLCYISRHHHPLGRDTLLFPLWNVCPHHTSCTQVCWGSTVLVNARCTNNRDNRCLLFAQPVLCWAAAHYSGAWGLGQLLVRSTCGPAGWRNFIQQELPFFMYTVLPQSTQTALWRHHSLVSRENEVWIQGIFLKTWIRRL